MSRTTLPLLQERIAPFALETCVKEAAELHQRTLAACTLPFPQAPDRGLSHYPCRPRPIACTAEGEGAGGRSWLRGSTIAVRCTRSLFAPDSSNEGGHCDAPASAFVLAVASRLHRSPDSASFCADLRQQE